MAGMRVYASPTNGIGGALRAAARADVAVVVAATTSGESEDRQHLNLDDGAEALIDAVARKAKKTVLLQVPGAVVMPWRNGVEGILTMFLGGQETGHAWADILFGDHGPSGRLPVMIPATEADTIPPSSGKKAVYSEGMATSYRNKDFVAAFPFGHGLSYATFYLDSDPRIVPCAAA